MITDGLYWQAEKLDRRFLGVEWLPSQIGAINPLLILTLVPLLHGADFGTPPGAVSCVGRSAFFARLGLVPRRRVRLVGLYELIARHGVRVTPLRKIGCGLVLCACSFLIPLQVEVWIEASGYNHSAAALAECNGAVGDGGGGGARGCGLRPSIAWQVVAFDHVPTDCP
jgi:hypothetical protein